MTTGERVKDQACMSFCNKWQSTTETKLSYPLSFAQSTVWTPLLSWWVLFFSNHNGKCYFCLPESIYGANPFQGQNTFYRRLFQKPGSEICILAFVRPLLKQGLNLSSATLLHQKRWLKRISHPHNCEVESPIESSLTHSRRHHFMILVTARCCDRQRKSIEIVICNQCNQQSGNFASFITTLASMIFI